MVGKRAYRNFNIPTTLHFISEVKLHRCLWDQTHQDHLNKNARDKAWEELSLSLGYNADELVAKWQSLRSSFRQYRFLKRRAKESGDAKAQIIKWPYYSAMSYTNRSSDDNDLQVISLSSCLETRLVPETSGIPPSTAKRPLTNPEPTTHSIVSEEIQISDPDQDSTEEYQPPTKQVPEKILLTKPAPFIKKQTPLKLGSKQPAIAKSTVPTTSHKMLKEPEFVAIQVEAIDLPSPIEQTFTGEGHGCSMRVQYEDEVYGHSIALQMKQFSPKTKRMLQIQIHELISKAQKQAFAKDFGFSYDSS
ncbi:uncharacterized protein LOC126567674 [Anopheles maculipalpis]|uniref:uncharacterized protein LOC126567674 n=1 Tax=Anopheles maculipalpis TaxID=1496333 RepID=UPI0021595139|nr:uncharacterized protein LOC126567674 [Anopheles maculipalpis]